MDLENIHTQLQNIQKIIHTNQKISLKIKYDNIYNPQGDIDLPLQRFNIAFHFFARQYGHLVSKVIFRTSYIEGDELSDEEIIQLQLQLISNFKYFTSLNDLVLNFDNFPEEDDGLSSLLLIKLCESIARPENLKSLKLNFDELNFALDLANDDSFIPEIENWTVFQIQPVEEKLLSFISLMNQLRNFSISGNFLSTFFMDGLNVCLRDLKSLESVSLTYKNCSGDLAPIYQVLKNPNIRRFYYRITGPTDLSNLQNIIIPNYPQIYVRPYQTLNTTIGKIMDTFELTKITSFTESKFPSINLDFSSAFEYDEGLGLHDTQTPNAYLTHHFLRFLQCFGRAYLDSLKIYLPQSLFVLFNNFTDVNLSTTQQMILLNNLFLINPITRLETSFTNYQQLSMANGFRYFLVNRYLARNIVIQHGLEEHMGITSPQQNIELLINTLPTSKISCFYKDLRLLYLFELISFKQLQSSSSVNIHTNILVHFGNEMINQLGVQVERNHLQIPGYLILKYLSIKDCRNLLLACCGGIYTSLFRNLKINVELQSEVLPEFESLINCNL